MLHISAPEKKYLLGIDLRGETCQISYMTNRRQRPYWNADEENIYGEPVTFLPGGRARESAAEGVIPICLCRSAGNDRWFFGEKAQQMSVRGEGPLIRGFLDEASFGRMMRFGSEHYNPASLLTIFFRGVLISLSAVVPLSQIDTMVFTSRKMNSDLEEVLRRITKRLSIEVSHVFCEDYARSFYSYVVMQPEKIRGNAAAVLDVSDPEGFYLNRLQFYADRTPALCLPDEERVRCSTEPAQERKDDGTQSGDPRDDCVYRYLEQTVRPDELASVYITGPGASDKWLKKSLAFLCRGRHAFRGNNLFSRGAAYSALIRTVQPEQAKENIYIDRNDLSVSIGMKILEENGGKEEEIYHEFLKAGTAWKNAQTDLEVVLESGRELRFVVTPVTGESAHDEILTLEGLPKRPKRTTMLHIHLSMLSARELEICVKDLGFGNLFPAAGRTWDKVVSV